jgi:hypothetical protein
VYRWIAVALHLAAVLTAWLYARRKGEHRPFAVWISVIAVADAIGFGLHAAFPVLDCPGPTGGFHGMIRAAFHGDEARFLAWPASIAWLGLRLFGKRDGSRSAEVLCVYVVAVAGLAFGYPIIRGDALRQFYLAGELTGLVVASGAVASWVTRGGWRETPLTILAALAVFLVELTLLATGPWSRGFFGAAWVTQNGGMIALYGVLTVLQGAAWYAERSRDG